MQENLRRSNRVIKRPLKIDEVQDFAPQVNRTKAIQNQIIDPQDLNQCAKLMSKFINSTNKKFKKAKIESKKIDEPIPIKQFKVVPEQQNEILIRLEQVNEKELEEMVKQKLRETKSMIVTSKKESKRRKRTKSEQIANVKDIDEPVICLEPQDPLFKRSNFHIAIAYHIHFKNITNDDGEIRKQELDPTIYAKRLLKSRSGK